MFFCLKYLLASVKLPVLACIISTPFAEWVYTKCSLYQVFSGVTSAGKFGAVAAAQYIVLLKRTMLVAAILTSFPSPNHDLRLNCAATWSYSLILLKVSLF